MKSQLFLVLLMLLCGCNFTAKEIAPEPFDLRAIAKSDIDMVAEMHIKETLKLLRTLMGKLYKRNPKQWKNMRKSSFHAYADAIFRNKHNWNFKELNSKKSIDSIYLTFADDFRGDRVLALISGLATMIIASFNNKTEFFILDELDSQKLYNAARNVEITIWKLSNDVDKDGNLFLISNGLSDKIANLSFERLFGKIIGMQDFMARVIADRTNRRIKNMIQSVASSVLLPI